MNENTPSEWKVMKNYINDEYMYAVYRLRDISRTDHTGNREMGSDYMTDKPQAIDLATKMNLEANRDPLIARHSSNINVIGHVGTWYAIDSSEIAGTEYFLLEHEEYGDEAACLITTSNREIVLENVWNGFDDLVEHLESLEEMDCPE